MGKSRFTLSGDEYDEDDVGTIQRGRFTLSGLSRKKYLPIAIVAAVALVAILIILLVTGYLYEKPEIYQSKDDSGKDAIYSEDLRKTFPETGSKNIHLMRGKESYFKGYLNDAITEFTEVVESDSDDREKAIALTYIGIIHDDRGEYDMAIEYYRRALRYDRRNSLIYRNMSLAYRHKKEFQKADEVISTALSLEPKNVKNILLSGNILFEQGKYEEAKSRYEEALGINPDNSSALYNMGITLLRLGDEVAAIEYLKRSASVDKIGAIAHLSYSKLGVIFTRHRDYELAEKYLKLAVSVRPGDPIDRYNLGIVYLKLNRHEEALAELIKAEELGKDDAEVLENLGEAYSSLKQYDRSIDVYNRLLAVNKRNVRVLSRIAELYYDKGDLDRAYESYERITFLEPATENARIAYLNMGNILDDAQRFGEAVDQYKRALAINPKDDAVYYNLGIAYKHLGQPERALESWRKANELKPDNPQPLLAIADYYNENKYYENAMEEYQAILRRWPNLQDAHFNLATIYYKKNLMDYARESFQRVIEIDEKNEFGRKALINLGILSSKKGSEEGLEKGFQNIQKALLLKPGDPEALLAMGTLYYKRKMYENAIDTYYQVLQATNDSKLIAEAYSNIGNCHYEQKMYKKAVQAYTRAIEEDPTNEEIRMNRKVAVQAYEEQLQY